MGKGSAKFTEADATRLFKCARKAGVKIRGRVTKDGIEFETCGPQGETEPDQRQDERTSEWAGAKPY